MSTFTLECFQNEYLPEGGTEVSAIVTITATGTSSPPVSSATSTEPARRAEIIIIDASGSMDGARIREARDAAAAAVDCLEDGTRFALVAGNHAAWRLYPEISGMGLAVASPAAKEDARRAVSRLKAGGGTAIGRWLELAVGLFGTEPGINHAILLTDGKDEGETPADLERALEVASGVFQCDCRGVGAGWSVPELRSVSTALLGSLDVVADPTALTGDFTRMMHSSLARSVADVHLRLWTPKGAEVEFVKQVSPEVVDLTTMRADVDEQAGDYPTGAWGDESRDYHIALKVAPAGIDDVMLAGRVTLMVDGQPGGQAQIRATWTDDVALSTRIEPRGAHYTGQADLADDIQKGLEALEGGDVETATERLARAVQRADESGNTQLSELLAKVVEVDDAATGKIRLKPKADPADVISLDTQSTKTVRVKK